MKKNYTALLSRTGMLRIPKELIPQSLGKLSFILTAFPGKKELELSPSYVKYNGSGPRRKAMYSNKAARSPLVCVMSALRFLQVQPKKTSIEFPIRKKKNGTLVVKF